MWHIIDTARPSNFSETSVVSVSYLTVSIARRFCTVRTCLQTWTVGPCALWLKELCREEHATLGHTANVHANYQNMFHTSNVESHWNQRLPHSKRGLNMHFLSDLETWIIGQF